MKPFTEKEIREEVEKAGGVGPHLRAIDDHSEPSPELREVLSDGGKKFRRYLRNQAFELDQKNQH